MTGNYAYPITLRQGVGRSANSDPAGANSPLNPAATVMAVRYKEPSSAFSTTNAPNLSRSAPRSPGSPWTVRQSGWPASGEIRRASVEQPDTGSRRVSANQVEQEASHGSMIDVAMG